MSRLEPTNEASAMQKEISTIAEQGGGTTKVEQLIQQYCPDGVEYKKLGEICNLSRGKVYSKSYIEENAGEYPVYSSQTANNGELGRISTYDYDGEYLTWTTDGAYAGTIFYRNGKFSITNVCGLISIKGNNLHIKFLFYWLCIKAPDYVYRGMGNPKLMSNQMEPIKVPLPPLPVQEEIVRILDNFTELQAELQAELQKRKQQYEYYKYELFNSIPKSSTKYTLDTLCSVITDGSHFSPRSVENGYYMPSVKDMRANGFDYSACKQISKEDYDELVKNGCKPKINDVLIAKDGSMLKYAFPVFKEDEIVILSSIAILRPRTEIVTPSYLAYYFRQERIKEMIVREQSSKGGVPRIVLKNFKKIVIPVPSLEEQQRIVDILDRFDTLTNDLTTGLPAEIEARRKQYEYYRDRLLTFKQKA